MLELWVWWRLVSAPLGLFAHTFLLLAVLMIASLAAWIQGFRTLETEQQARQVAQQIVTMVNITRAALVYSAEDERRDLLLDLLTNEGIQIYPREPNDLTSPVPASSRLLRIKDEVRARLGDQTEFVWSVNRLPGLWVSFTIFDDPYWVVVPRDRAERTIGPEWLGWAAAAVVLSLVGAAVIVGYLNQPLSRLARAAQSLGRGERPRPLPDLGPQEIRDVNRSFNRMVEELDRAETDRSVMLAGISHDLRTPLTRLRLELELADLPESTRAAIADDIEQMDRTISQFMEYARPVNHQAQPENVSEALELLLRREQQHFEALGGQLSYTVQPGLWAELPRHDLERIVSNLLENSRRYGRRSQGSLWVRVCARGQAGRLRLQIDDAGPGVAHEEIPRLLRPFTRGAEARSDTRGAGLGLAIVQRLVERHRGELRFERSELGGLCVILTWIRRSPAPSAHSEDMAPSDHRLS